MRSTLAVLSTLLLLGVGCVDADPSLVMSAGHVGQGELLGDLLTCTFEADGGFIHTNLTADVSGPMFLGVVVRNTLGNSEDFGAAGERQLRRNNNAIMVERIDFSFDSPRFTSFERQVSFLVETGATGSLTVPVMNVGEQEFFGGQLGGDSTFATTAEIQAIGRTLGGTSVESNIVRMPILFCRNCGGSSPNCVAPEEGE